MHEVSTGSGSTGSELALLNGKSTAPGTDLSNGANENDASQTSLIGRGEDIQLRITWSQEISMFSNRSLTKLLLTLPLLNAPNRAIG